MELKISRIVPFCGKETQKSQKPIEKKQDTLRNIDSLQNVYYLHPAMNADSSPELLNIYSKLYTNDCPIDYLKRIESLSEKEKESFVRTFCKHTGFPELEKVNNKMKLHAISAMNKSADEADTKLLYCGYHNHCSAANNLALPGSDLDAMGAIITGNQENLNRFNGGVWRNFDPTIVSIRKDFETPDVFTLEQVFEWTKMMDEIIENSPMSEKKDKYKANMKEKSDYERALEFNIDMAKALDNYSLEELQEKSPSVAELLTHKGKTPKNVTQSISSMLESLRSGHVLIQNDMTPEERAKFEAVKNTNMYKYGNICIQDADYGIKDKLLRRKEIINRDNFEQMSIDDKTDLILRMLYESYPSWAKSKLEDMHWGLKFDKLFDNGENVDEKRNAAFSQTVD